MTELHLLNHIGTHVDAPAHQVGDGDTLADPVDTTTYDLHRIWLSWGRMIIENVANFDQVPARTQVIVAPLKLRDANGAPARILAMVQNS